MKLYTVGYLKTPLEEIERYVASLDAAVGLVVVVWHLLTHCGKT